MNLETITIRQWNSGQKLLHAELSLERKRVVNEAKITSRGALELALERATFEDAEGDVNVVWMEHRQRLCRALQQHDDNQPLGILSQEEDGASEFLTIQEWTPPDETDETDDPEDPSAEIGGTAIADFGVSPQAGSAESRWSAFEANRLEAAIFMTAAEIALEIFRGIRPHVRPKEDAQDAVDIAKMTMLRYLNSDKGIALCERKFKEANARGLPFFEQTCPQYLRFRTENLLDGTLTYLNVSED